MKRLLAVLALVGLLSACSSPATPQEPDPLPETPSPVYTDWSKLTPYVPPESLYTYFSPYSGKDTLLPRNDYGTLLSYMGVNVVLESYIIDRMPLYGLVTDKGELVTEPIYTSITFLDDFLLLAQGEIYGTVETNWGTLKKGGFAYTIAASDGSWVREIGAAHEIFTLDGEYLAAAMLDGSVQVFRRDGSTALEVPRAALEPYLGAEYEWSWDMGPCLGRQNGWLLIWDYHDETDKTYYLHPESGEILTDPPQGWDDDAVDEEWQEPPEVPGYTYLNEIIDSATGIRYYSGSRVDGEESVYDLMDESGQVIYQGCALKDVYLWTPIVRAGLISSVENGIFSYHSIADGHAVFRFPLRTNTD